MKRKRNHFYGYKLYINLEKKGSSKIEKKTVYGFFVVGKTENYLWIYRFKNELVNREDIQEKKKYLKIN